MLTKILTLLAPGLTLIANWCTEFKRLIALRHLHPKTILKRKGNIAHLKCSIGHIRIGSVRPVHIAQAVHELWQSGRQNTAGRVLPGVKNPFQKQLLPTCP
ncbi:MAG: hypothetical protein NC211_06580 [Alistipes senegalensis]|nr:hypothetical protein [Oxalobacter formigenes]MCM1281476.1 hypothetical protein [Alistipes senegalensis]